MPQVKAASRDGISLRETLGAARKYIVIGDAHPSGSRVRRALGHEAR
jgi:hypothetical protein